MGGVRNGQNIVTYFMDGPIHFYLKSIMFTYRLKYLTVFYPLFSFRSSPCSKSCRPLSRAGFPLYPKLSNARPKGLALRINQTNADDISVRLCATAFEKVLSGVKNASSEFNWFLTYKASRSHRAPEIRSDRPMPAVREMNGLLLRLARRIRIS